MLRALMILLVCQLVGEVTARTLGLPLPGPVLGMILLWLILLARGSIPSWLEETARTIVQHLSLLFVPAGVGVMTHFDLLQREWFILLMTIMLSTLITMIVTAVTMRLLVSRTK